MSGYTQRWLKAKKKGKNTVLKDIKVLVTGGAGFIGSHLCQALLKKGYQVICLDNFLTGSKKNIEDFLDNPRFSFIEHDVIKKFSPATSYKLQVTSHIYHLASPASPKKYQKYPLETLLANSLGTYNFLTLAKKYDAKFLYASSSEVYGEPNQHPQKETYWGNVNPTGLRSCYDEAKRFGEAMTMAFARKEKVNARIVRIFNTYGPKMDEDDGRVISNFITQAIKTKPITVYGDGSQTRSFCYVSDMVEGLVKAMESDKTERQVFNLGNSDEQKVIAMAKLIKKITKSSSAITFASLPVDDPSRRKPDITKARKYLGWRPKVTLEKGLKKTIKYFLSLTK